MARGAGRGPSKRVVLHRQTLDEVTLGIADGLFELAREIVVDAAAIAPDSPYDPFPAGEGLPLQGGALAYAQGKKTAGWSQRGRQPSPPRAARAGSSKRGVLVVGGFGFPGRFAEFGTIRQPGQPFLSPTLARKADRAIDRVGNAVRLRLAKVL